jgi:hypothetical protein
LNFKKLTFEIFIACQSPQALPFAELSFPGFFPGSMHPKTP